MFDATRRVSTDFVVRADSQRTETMSVCLAPELHREATVWTTHCAVLVEKSLTNLLQSATFDVVDGATGVSTDDRDVVTEDAFIPELPQHPPWKARALSTCPAGGVERDVLPLQQFAFVGEASDRDVRDPVPPSIGRHG